MDIEIIRLEQPAVQEDALFRILKMDPEDEAFSEDIRAMFRHAASMAVPKAVYTLSPVTEKGDGFVTAGGVRIESALVRKNLDQADRIAPFAATCGVELEEWSRAYDDPLEAYWADGIKMLYLGLARQAVTAEIRSRFFPVGDMSCMTPGSLPAWPLPAQRTLFTLLHSGASQIGISLTESFLMQPSKSVSGFYFSARHHYENCTYCPMPHCPGRSAPYRGKTE